MINAYFLHLRGYGNPDYQQFCDIAPTMFVQVRNQDEAKELFDNYRLAFDLGGGNCGPEHGLLFEGVPTKYVGYFSFNGKFWPVDCASDCDDIRVTAAKNVLTKVSQQGAKAVKCWSFEEAMATIEPLMPDVPKPTPVPDTTITSVRMNCPICLRETMVEEAMKEVFQYSNLYAIDENGAIDYGHHSCDGGEVFQYRCGRCSYIITDEAGNPITDGEELYAWLKKNMESKHAQKA